MWRSELTKFFESLPATLPRYRNDRDFQRMDTLMAAFVRDVRRRCPAELLNAGKRVLVERGRGTGWLMPTSAELAGAASVAVVPWQQRTHSVSDFDVVISDDGERNAMQDARDARADPRILSSPLRQFYPAYGHKHTYARAVRDAQQAFGESTFAVHPESFEFPAEETALREAMARGGDDDWWIVKPVHGFSGKGIYMIDKHDPLPDASTAEDEYIVQRYIRPLLADGFKFDFRVYCLLLTNPLRIYTFNDGIVRLASTPYKHRKAEISNKCMHITNSGYQRPHCKNYIGNYHRVEDKFSHLWSVKKLVRHMEEEHGNPASRTWTELSETIAKSILVNDAYLHNVSTHNPHPQFQMFGPDLTYDDSAKPWIIEINAFPTTTQCCPLDTHIKAHVLTDMWSILGVQPFDRAPYQDAVSDKIEAFCQARAAGGQPPCTASDIRGLWAIEDEDRVRGGFTLAYPTPDLASSPLSKLLTSSEPGVRAVADYLAFRAEPTGNP